MFSAENPATVTKPNESYPTSCGCVTDVSLTEERADKLRQFLQRSQVRDDFTLEIIRARHCGLANAMMLQMIPYHLIRTESSAPVHVDTGHKVLSNLWDQ